MIEDLLPRLRERNKVILIHGNADPDALGSAYALSRCFPEAQIVAPMGLDRISKRVAENLGITVREKAPLDEYDVIVAVDTSSPEQVGLSGPVDRRTVVIDHHSPSDRWGDALFLCDESRRSCAELIFDIIRKANVRVDHETGLALLIGMVTDSGHFRYANSALMRSFSEVMEESGVEMDEVLSLAELEQEMSERISQLKGAQRLRFDRVGEHIVAVSHGSSYESSICKSLLSLGADVAFVGSQRDHEVRISARATQALVRKGLHLGRMLDGVGMDTSSNGGGHGGAAGLMGTGDVEALLNMCKHKAMDLLRSLKEER